MKKCFLLITLLLTFSMPAVAVNYLQISVTSGLIGSDGNEILSVITFMDNHLVDLAWTAPSQYREMTLVAGDYLSNWYSVLGADSGGRYQAYIFSGLDVDPGHNISTMFHAVGNSQWDALVLENNGNTIFHEVISGGNRAGLSLVPIPAGLNQKRTRGYSLMVTSVPEPGSILALFVGLAGLLARKKR